MAQKLLAWAPRVQLNEGLMKTIEYFDGLLGGMGMRAKAGGADALPRILCGAAD